MSIGDGAQEFDELPAALGRRVLGLPAHPTRDDATVAAVDTAHEEPVAAHEERVLADAALRAQDEEIERFIREHADAGWLHERLRTVLPVARLETDASGGVRSANVAAEQLIGVKSRRIVGKQFVAFLAAADRLEVQLIIADLSPGERREAGLTVVPRDRPAVRVDAHATAIAADISRERGIEWVMLISADGTPGHAGSTASVAKVLSDLVQLPLHTSRTHAVLRAAAAACGDAIGPGTSVSVSVNLGQPVEPADAASANLLAQLVDGAQVTSGEGPCQSAWETEHTIVCDDLRSDTRWPAFATAVQGLDVASVLAAPVKARDDVVGVLNAYSPIPRAFGADALGVVDLLAGAIGAVIHHLEVGHEIERLSGQMKRALASRATIDQAKGIVMALHGGSADDAFAQISRASQSHNVKLRVIAAEIVRRAESRDGSDPSADATTA